MRHQVPDGDVGKILARAVAVLLEQVRKRRFGACSTPRSEVPEIGAGAAIEEAPSQGRTPLAQLDLNPVRRA